MAMELLAGYLEGKAGTVRYHPAFADIPMLRGQATVRADAADLINAEL